MGLNSEEIMDNQIELRAAKLLIHEAINKLRESVFPAGCEEWKRGDREFGVELAQRIECHKNKIDNAISYWRKCFDYYEIVRDKNKTIKEFPSSFKRENSFGEEESS